MRKELAFDILKDLKKGFNIPEKIQKVTLLENFIDNVTTENEYLRTRSPYKDIEVKLSRFNLRDGDLLVVQSPNLSPAQTKNLQEWLKRLYPKIRIIILGGKYHSFIRIPNSILIQLGIDINKNGFDGMEINNKTRELKGFREKPTFATIRNDIKNLRDYINFSLDCRNISPSVGKALFYKLNELENLVEKAIL